MYYVVAWAVYKYISIYIILHLNHSKGHIRSIRIAVLNWLAHEISKIYANYRTMTRKQTVLVADEDETSSRLSLWDEAVKKYNYIGRCKLKDNPLY